MPNEDAWLQTFTGRAVSINNPSADDIDPVDIAHGLSNLCRYGGQTSRFYSVGEHSVLIEHFAPPPLKLEALLHDAHEAYIGDVIWPIKQGLPGYRTLEQKFQSAVCSKYGLALEVPSEVKELDRRIWLNERKALLNPWPKPWPSVKKGDTPIKGLRIECWKPYEARGIFLSLFNQHMMRKMECLSLGGIPCYPLASIRDALGTCQSAAFDKWFEGKTGIIGVHGLCVYRWDYEQFLSQVTSLV